MGGYGSGQYGFLGETPKTTVEQCLELSISQLKPNLTPSQQQVKTKFGGKSYVLLLAWTDCNYGSQRPWFLCPQCQRRVGKLYLRSLIEPLACRSCHNLTYRSCQSSKGPDTLNLQYEKLKKKLKAKGTELSRFDSIPFKPKGMHWRTYERICRQLKANELKFCQNLSKLLGHFS